MSHSVGSSVCKGHLKIQTGVRACKHYQRVIEHGGMIEHTLGMFDHASVETLHAIRPCRVKFNRKLKCEGYTIAQSTFMLQHVATRLHVDIICII